MLEERNYRDYLKLVKLAKNGDYEAYHKLCTYFLEYIPSIFLDLKPVIEETNIEMDDLYQEGCVAICEALQIIMVTDKDYAAKSIFDIIMMYLLNHLYEYIHKKIYKDNYEEPKNIQYDESDTFKKYLEKINNQTRYKLIRDFILLNYQSPKCDLNEEDIKMMNDQTDKREKFILEYRILPEEPDDRLTLQEIALIFNIHKSKVQQIEKATMHHLDGFLFYKYHTSLKDLLKY